MQKMMTYSEANSVLGSSLTPTNRCLSKAVAIANDADPDLLANFDNARLVPANVIEPATHWIDEHTIEHYFVDENGNNLGTDITVVVPLHARYLPITTKTLIDGECPTAEFKGGKTDSHSTQDRSKWTRPLGNQADGVRWDIIYTQDPDYINHVVYPSGMSQGSGSSSTGFVIFAPTRSDGTAHYNLAFREEGSWGQEFYGLNFPSDTVNSCKLQNLIDQWNIHVYVERRDVGYDVSQGVVELRGKDVGYSKDITVTGFSGSPIVEFLPFDDYGYDQFTQASVSENIITIQKTKESRSMFNIYKVYDSADNNKCIYIGARDN